MAEHRERLGIYLNDHLAGATGGVELARRCLSENQGTPLGSFLERFVDELEEDRSFLAGVMERLDLDQASYKQAAAWTVEKLGRLKPNDRLRGYSGLSRLLELEGLMAGVQAKRSMWRSLLVVADSEPGIADLDLSALIRRADQQIEELEGFRMEAAGDIFSAS